MIRTVHVHGPDGLARDLVPQQGSSLGGVKQSRLQSEPEILLQPDLHVVFPLRCEDIVEDTHFSFILRPAPDFLRALSRQLPVGR